jgi:hypothetical protein
MMLFLKTMTMVALLAAAGPLPDQDRAQPPADGAQPAPAPPWDPQDGRLVFRAVAGAGSWDVFGEREGALGSARGPTPDTVLNYRFDPCDPDAKRCERLTLSLEMFEHQKHPGAASLAAFRSNEPGCALTLNPYGDLRLSETLALTPSTTLAEIQQLQTRVLRCYERLVG